MALFEVAPDVAGKPALAVHLAIDAWRGKAARRSQSAKSIDRSAPTWVLAGCPSKTFASTASRACAGDLSSASAVASGSRVKIAMRLERVWLTPGMSEKLCDPVITGLAPTPACNGGKFFLTPPEHPVYCYPNSRKGFLPLRAGPLGSISRWGRGFLRAKTTLAPLEPELDNASVGKAAHGRGCPCLHC